MRPVSICMERMKGIEPSYQAWEARMYGADEGDRTLVPSLGSSYSTTELHPHVVALIKYIKYTSPL